MKLKNSTKEKAKQSAAEAIGKAVPVIDKPVGRLQKWTRVHPYASITIMFTVVVFNIAAIYIFTDNFSPLSFNLKGLKQNITDSTGQVNDMGIPFSFKNYREMIEIKDSLEYLMNKPKRTASDTALALRLFQKMEKLDPDFFNQLKRKKYDTTIQKK